MRKKEQVFEEVLKKSLTTASPSPEMQAIIGRAWNALGTSDLELMFTIAEAVGNFEDWDALVTVMTLGHATYVGAKLFDDLIDQDKMFSIADEYGVAICANVVLFLLTFVYSGLGEYCQRSPKLNTYNKLEAVTQIQKDLFFGASGQFRDFINAKTFVNEQEFLETASLKSGKVIGAIFSMVVLGANGSMAQLDKYRRVGQICGLLDQLVNDLRSCATCDLKRNSLVQGIVTLPVVYLLNQASPYILEQFQNLWKLPVEIKAETERLQMLTLLEQGGALVATAMRLAQVFNEIVHLLDISSNPADIKLLNLIKASYFREIMLTTTNVSTLTRS